MISFWITILTIVSSIVAQYYPNPNAYGNQYPAQPSYGFHRNITNPYPAPAPYPAPYPGNPPPYPVNPQPYPAARPTYGFKRNNTNNATDAGSSPTTFIIGVKGNGDQLLQQIPVFKKVIEMIAKSMDFLRCILDSLESNVTKREFGIKCRKF